MPETVASANPRYELVVTVAFRLSRVMYEPALTNPAAFEVTFPEGSVITFTVDPLYSIREVNENNNAASLTFNDPEELPQPLPDLVVTDLAIIAEDPRAGQTIRLAGFIINIIPTKLLP